MARPERVGLVGLGHMGGPMAARLVAAGVRLAVFDVREEAVRGAAALGADPARSLAELGRRSEVVITMLPDGRAVRRAVLGTGPGADRLLGALRAGTVLVDMGSSPPIATRELGRAVAEHGIAMLDAPVSGGVGRAETGRLSVMVGGAGDVIAACRPVLELLAEQIFVVGPLGSAHALKALNNLVSAAGLLAAGEALLIGQRFGLDPSLMIDVFNASTARNNATENKLRQFVLSRSFASGFSLALMVKDLATALELAEETGTPAPFGAACRDLWARAERELGEPADHTAVVRWLETLAHTTLAAGEE
jgi:3-hydroxyisobutyrate dehydrogenase